MVKHYFKHQSSDLKWWFHPENHHLGPPLQTKTIKDLSSPKGPVTNSETCMATSKKMLLPIKSSTNLGRKAPRNVIAGFDGGLFDPPKSKELDVSFAQTYQKFQRGVVLASFNEILKGLKGLEKASRTPARYICFTKRVCSETGPFLVWSPSYFCLHARCCSLVLSLPLLLLLLSATATAIPSFSSTSCFCSCYLSCLPSKHLERCCWTAILRSWQFWNILLQKHLDFWKGWNSEYPVVFGYKPSKSKMNHPPKPRTLASRCWCIEHTKPSTVNSIFDSRKMHEENWAAMDIVYASTPCGPWSLPHRFQPSVGKAHLARAGLDGSRASFSKNEES